MSPGRDDARPLRAVADHPSTNGAGPVEYTAVRLADVAPERVRWLWPGRLPVGKLVVLDGDPGVAKSTIALDLAARVSTGRPMPDDTTGDLTEARDVVLMSAEDGLADTIRPRLDAAGADVARVHAFLDVVIRAGDTVERRSPVLPDDVDQLDRLVADRRAALVIVDVLMAYLSADTNSYRDQDVRRALTPIAAMAERRGCCVLVLRHLRKASVGSAIYAGGGSIGIVGAARVGLTAGFDPDDDDVEPADRRRVLAVSKVNIARQAPSLGYRVVDHNDVGRIDWLGPVKHGADDLVSAERDTDRGDRDAFLHDLLDAGPQSSKAVEKAARDAGWTMRQLRPTLHRLGGRAVKAGFDEGWMWTLRPPEGATEDDEGDHVHTWASSSSSGHVGDPFDGMEDF